MKKQTLDLGETLNRSEQLKIKGGSNCDDNVFVNTGTFDKEKEGKIFNRK
jgi:hypothetical protein